MNYFTKFTFLVCLSFLMTNSLLAQNFYEENFGDQTAAEANWVGGGTNGGTEDWFWSDDPSILTFGSEPDFAATTASNGFFVFDSDTNGENAHDVTLTGPAIDCSNEAIVIASFQNQYSFFSAATVSLASLGVSTDGTNFNYYPILENVASNDLTEAVQNVVVDISADAAGQPTVYLQFRWEGFYEYAWKIDDIALSAEDPTPAHDLAIVRERYAPNFLQPSSQLDTVGFGVHIKSFGSAIQENIDITAEILTNGASIFSTTETYESVLAQATDTVSLMEVYPETGDGVYTIRYNIEQDSTDANPADNTKSREFEIAPGLFSKDDGEIISATQPGSVADIWEIGNYYYVKNGGFKATDIFFSVASNGDAHQGQSVTLKLYKVTEDADTANFTDDDVTLVGIAQHEFTNEANYALVSASFESLITGDEGVILDEDSEYFAMIAYSPDMFAPYSAIPYEFQVGTVIYDGDWFLGGFGPGNTVLSRLAIAPIIDGVQDFDLPEDNSLEIFPNPVNEVLTLDIDLTDVAFQATIRIVDASGKMIYKNIKENVKTEKVEINVANYPAGAYMLHFSNENGVRTKRFVVGK